MSKVPVLFDANGSFGKKSSGGADYPVLADRLAYKLVSIGFPMLTIGIITGSLWAQSAWSSYWNWDPKETWSLITWLVYAAYLHVRLISRRRGKWSNRLLVIGFLCVLMTFVGVNLLDFGLHRYNW